MAGIVYGSPKFKDGEEVLTSSIVSLNLDQHVAFTKFSKYELGEPLRYGVGLNARNALRDAERAALTEVSRALALAERDRYHAVDFAAALASFRS
jgi:hypothetical protein